MYQLLISESFRRRPAMYIGKLSILYLRVYLDGYRHALTFYSIKEEKNILEMELPNFNNFVANYYKIPPLNGWEHLIIEQNNGDEANSFKDFFLLFDNFFNITKNEDFYLNLSKLYRGEVTQNEIVFS